MGFCGVGSGSEYCPRSANCVNAEADAAGPPTFLLMDRLALWVHIRTRCSGGLFFFSVGVRSTDFRVSTSCSLPSKCLQHRGTAATRDVNQTVRNKWIHMPFLGRNQLLWVLSQLTAPPSWRRKTAPAREVICVAPCRAAIGYTRQEPTAGLHGPHVLFPMVAVQYQVSGDRVRHSRPCGIRVQLGPAAGRPHLDRDPSQRRAL